MRWGRRCVSSTPLTCTVPALTRSWASFRDLPECLTSGAQEVEALAEAADALEEAIAGRMVDDDAIPRPSARRAGEHLVAVPPAMAAKAALVPGLPGQRPFAPRVRPAPRC